MSSVVRSTIVRLRAEMAQFKKEWNDGTGAVKGTREELGRAAKQAKATKGELDSTGTSVGKLSNNLRNHRKEWDLVGTSLIKTGLGLVAVSGLVTKAAIDWETAWAGVTKTVSGTPAELAAVEAGLRGLAKSMPESHTQIAAVAEAAGQLGVQTKDIVDFTRVMVMLGDTTNLSADEAATSIAQLMNVMQTAPEDVDRLGATLVALGNSGASTERDIIQMAQRISGAGEIVGLTEAQVLSLANALSSSGIEVEAGGSAISNVLIDISKAVDTGSDKLGIFAKVAGTTAEDFAAKWKSDPASALADFTEGLGGMADRGENVFGTLEKLGQSDIRVTRALLNMANAGDLLRTSLAQGDAAWQKNTALVAEAEKRYDTTAAKIQIAWNNIKDNAIDAGQGMLPVLSAVSDIVIAIADAFGALPDPVKAGLGVLAGGAGIALLAAGAFLKVVGTAYDLNKALTQLDTSGSAGARGLGKVGKAAGIATVALTAYYAIQATQTGGEDVAGTNKFVKELLGVAAGSKEAGKELEKLANINGKQDIFNISDSPVADINGLKDLFKSASRNKLQSLGNKITPYDDAYDTAQKGIKQIDQALTSMVQSGAADEAAKAFAYLRKETGQSVDDLKKKLPGYAEAVQGVANEQKLAAESGDKLAGVSDRLGTRLAELSPDAEEAKKILADLEKGTADAALSFLDLSAKIDTSKTSFSSWLKDLEKQQRAMEDWADNMVKATQRGVSEGVIKEFEKMGPEGAKRLAELVDASDEEIDRLNDVFARTHDGAARLAEILNSLPHDVITEFKTAGADGAIEKAQELAVKYNLTPDEVRTILQALDYASPDIAKVLEGLGVVDGKTVTSKVKAEADQAKRVLREVKRLLDAINPFKTITVTTRNKTVYDHGQQKADGGPIDGVGGPKQDNILVAASVGEHMWTAREVANVGGHGAVYAMRAEARAGKRPKFADGGAVDDAWNASYRSAAARYGAPVSSQQPSPTVFVQAPSGGSQAPMEIDYERLADAVAARKIILGTREFALAVQEANNFARGNS